MPITSSVVKFTDLISGRDSSWNAISASNLSLSRFYRGGSIIPNIGYAPNNSVPTSGQISISSLRGCWRFFVENSTLSLGTGVGYVASGKYAYPEYFYGFSQYANLGTNGAGAFGSLSNATYTTPTGTYVIVALYSKIDYVGNRYVQLILRRTDNGYPPNDDSSFVGLTSPNFPNLSNRSAAIGVDYLSAFGLNFTRWTWSATTNPGGGNYSIDRRFYGW